LPKWVYIWIAFQSILKYSYSFIKLMYANFILFKNIFQITNTLFNITVPSFLQHYILFGWKPLLLKIRTDLKWINLVSIKNLFQRAPVSFNNLSTDNWSKSLSWLVVNSRRLISKEPWLYVEGLCFKYFFLSRLLLNWVHKENVSVGK